MHSGQVGTIDEDISQQRRSTLRLAVAAVAMPAWLQGCSSAGDAQEGAEGLIGKESLAVGGAEEGKGFRARLYTPTFIEKLNGRYFIVDCWHHRIIHASDLNTPLVRWQTLVFNTSYRKSWSPFFYYKGCKSLCFKFRFCKRKYY